MIVPEEVNQIINTLENNNFLAYIVGGCVRDSILGKIPYDWDITTNALPEQIIKCFEQFRIITTGLKHGTVTVIINHKAFEITTFRIDGTYSDNRRPDKVEFTTDIKEDLSRRDFTINAIAYNPKTGFVDFFNGKEDIKNKIVRCVGEPDLRFNEDALRVMRALRFASVLNFTLDIKTTNSIHTNKELLNNIAVERISTELNKLLLGDNIKFILQNFYDVIAVFMPEIKKMVGFNQNNKYHHLDVWEHTIESIINTPKDIILRLSMFFHDIGKPSCYTEDKNGAGHFYGHPAVSSKIAVEILKRLKYDNFTISTVKELVFYHDYTIKPKTKIVKRLLNKLGEERVKQLFEIKKADILAHNPKYIDSIKDVYATNEVLNKVIEQQQCFALKDLAVKGNDLIEVGVPKGKQVGIILNQLMDMVIDDKLENDKAKLLEMSIQINKKIQQNV